MLEGAVRTPTGKYRVETGKANALSDTAAATGLGGADATEGAVGPDAADAVGFDGIGMGRLEVAKAAALASAIGLGGGVTGMDAADATDLGVVGTS